MANEKVYANGLTGKIQETKFGTITKLSFKKDEFIKFLNENGGDWVNVDLLPKKDGSGLYGVLNDYKPKGSSTAVGNNRSYSPNNQDDDLPF